MKKIGDFLLKYGGFENAFESVSAGMATIATGLNASITHCLSLVRMQFTALLAHLMKSE